jgi:Mrp family chromosome partitioning ATPase
MKRVERILAFSVSLSEFNYNILMSEGQTPDNANENCPGVLSNEAGKKEAGEGCPNQALCATGALQVDPAIAIIQKKFESIKHVILVLSGKGGVGKSTVATQLALLLSKKYEVGLLDVDICGPSVPTLLGLVGQSVHQSAEGWSPVYYEDLAVMSIGFLLDNHNDAVIWRGPRKNGLIKQFLQEVNWGELDYLIIDSNSLLI